MAALARQDEGIDMVTGHYEQRKARATRMFRRITGAGPAGRAPYGDALLNGSRVIVRMAHGNEVECAVPVAYLPFVVRRAISGEWWVVPPNVVATLAVSEGQARYVTGRLECCVLDVRGWNKWRVTERDLGSAVHQAVLEGQQYPELADDMKRYDERLREIDAEASRRLKLLIAEPGQLRLWK